ncbi:hypothetical protein ACFWP7_13210 [Streptomyces sp. NPDC058470]|uniref:hypothetical protein n=1 Tax=Streptomyces sp. NPDC058470 TaxID=3346515 RepID=UPI00364953DC
MSENDIQLLALGATLGVYLMLAFQIAFGILDDQRDRKVIRAAEASLEAAQQTADA